MDDEPFTFLPGDRPETWLVRHAGTPIGAVGYADGDGRWRAAWKGILVGTSYASREEAAEMLLERMRLERALQDG